MASKNKKEKEVTKVSSGYTAAEIDAILRDAEAVFTAKENDALRGVPSHKKSYFDQNLDQRTCNSNGYEDFVYFEVNGQPLRIELGFEAERDVQVVKTRLHSGFDNSSNAAITHLYFKGDAGIEFDVTAFINVDDAYIGDKVGDEINYDNRTVFPVLDDWHRTNTVCKIITFSPLIENGYYRITKFKPKQIYADYIHCQITFTQDTYNYERPLATKQPGSTLKEAVEGVGVTRIDPVNLGGGSKPKYTGLAKQLYDCNTLSKKCTCLTTKLSTCVTKYVHCTYVLQQCLRKVGLYFDGKVDGLYCYITYNAVRQFQQRYPKELNVTGAVDEKTKLKLCEVVQNGK